MYYVGNLISILEDRIKKLARWLVPTNQTGVRGFLGAINITRRWVKNFAEIFRPLSRLIGKVEWRQTLLEQLAFEIIKIKYTTRNSIYRLDFNLVIYFYTDALGYVGGLAITQFQLVEAAEAFGSKAIVEVPVIYDSFTFISTRRKYPIYKRELYIIVEFAKKYDYLCKYLYYITIIYTNYKPLIYFLLSDIYKGIYSYQVDQLRRLNVKIRYIPSYRNKITNVLLRTLFDSNCFQTLYIKKAYYRLVTKGSRQIQKDGKEGFKVFFNSLLSSKRNEVLNKGTVHSVSVFVSTATSNTSAIQTKAYRNLLWFSNIYILLLD